MTSKPKLSDLSFRRAGGASLAIAGIQISPFKSFHLFLALVLVSIVAGCKVGPNYHRPSPVGTNAMPPRFLGASTNVGDWKPAQPSAHLPRGTWWKLFNDDELNRLETLATVSNQEIAGALARLDQARASVNVARADLLPQANLDAAYVRRRTSFNDPQDGHPAGATYTFNTFAMPLTAGWEADLWGRVRRQVESARSQLAANAADLEVVKLTIQTEVAIDYITLRTVAAEHDLVARSIEAFRRSLELTTNRRKGGIASDLDVFQAETLLRSAEADLPPLKLQRAKLTHALATLCGQPAPGFALALRPLESAETPPVPVALPSELLERRPDIAAAEQRMAGANAQIGVAQSAFYPRVRINGLAGLTSIDAATWFNWPSRVWAVGPSLELPLFTGGRNRAQLAFSRAAYDELVAEYRQTVLRAFQEVEDRLAAQQLLKVELEAEAAAAASAERTLEIANHRYKGGLVTYLEVATSQSAALTRERNLVQLRGAKLAASVALIKALGGGWQTGVNQPPP